MDDLDSIDAMDCPRCLVRCDVVGTTERPYWMCPGCRVAYLSAE